MGAWYGYCPAQVDALSLYDMIVMMRGARIRRAESWLQIGWSMAPFAGEGFDPMQVVPESLRGVLEPTQKLTPLERIRAAKAKGRAKTDRTNAERAKKGLPPLPYKE